MGKSSIVLIGLRIKYKGAKPIHWTGGDSDFGLQDKDEVLYPGDATTDGHVIFDLSVDVKYGANGEPVFLGKFTHGAPAKRFLYLSWRNADGAYAMRFKLPLSSISNDDIGRAIKTGNRLVGELIVPIQRATQTGANIGGTREIVWK